MENSLNNNELNNAKTDNKNVKLSLREKISYGFGDFGNGFMFDLGQSYLTKFFIDTCGISAGAVGGIFAFTKIFDAFMDPLAGSLIDGRKASKSGKFRPVMMISSIILALLTVITFTMPEIPLSSKIIYGYATYMIWGLVYSFTNVPYGSLASVMTRDVEERSQLATFRQAGSLGAQLITGVAFVPILMMFSDKRVGYPIAAAVMAVIGIISFFICFINTKEHVVVNREGKSEKASAKDYFKVVFTNRPLLCLILMQLFTISAMNTNNGMMIFFCQYNLGDIALQPKVNGIMIGCSVIGIFAIPFLVKMFGKKKTAITGLVIGIIANGLNFIIPTNPTTFTILVTIGYVALAIPNGVTWAFVTDAIDYGHWHTGIRKEGVTYAAFNFSRKIAQSIAALVSASVLGMTGYVANAQQSAETLLGIKGAMTLYPAIALALAAIVVGVLHNLPDDKYRKVAQDLQEGRWENGNLE
ncbi:sugar (Glycoside-Pentoside-Hexuronide) transporter [Clostridium sp. DL-VIII]|uniref:glycoside-pentoside-hexuronide (GPH):cation symporter n=1 Tax=Clostridium sp. DL-VIII TaxID=641107 RepID=UPI00023AFBD6|nr:glycoside-pentoside-hexuronide (GPH):cation symporter [Clostridium sp. DL-VIII]EHJ00137.1 sugar (Glycoside-Pentoside-Hexuronide) transporter [Clostridium sp. DL-VIII]